MTKNDDALRWKLHSARWLEYQHASEREDSYRKASTELGTFTLKSLLTISAGATALLIGFKRESTDLQQVADAILPYTSAVVLLTLASAAFGYLSLAHYAEMLGRQPMSWHSDEERQKREKKWNFWAGYSIASSWASVVVFAIALALLSAAAVKAITVLI